MADVRALLRAKRQEARVSHPAAFYTQDGQLRCSTCNIGIKQASMWQGHVGSKSHRVNASRLRAQAEAEAEAQQRMEEEQNNVSSPPPEKRQASEEPEDDTSPVSKRRRVGDEDHTMDVSEPTPAPVSIIPSAASLGLRLPPVRGTTSTVLSSSIPTAGNGPSIPKTKIDEEFEMFERELAMDDNEEEEQRRDAFSRATVMAEAELVEDQEDDIIPEGAAPTAAEDDTQKAEQQRDTRAQREKEDHELIMDRLLEEERAQEEADSRVGMLKSRVEMLKKQRAARKTKS